MLNGLDHGCRWYILGCQYDGVEYSHGDSWRPASRPCDVCICYNGVVTCRNRERCSTACANGVYQNGSCCSECTGRHALSLRIVSTAGEPITACWDGVPTALCELFVASVPSFDSVQDNTNETDCCSASGNWGEFKVEIWWVRHSEGYCTIQLWVFKFTAEIKRRSLISGLRWE